MPYFLQPRHTHPHTVVVIVLDWTRPWTFLEGLHTWLAWVERWIQGDGRRELKVINEEHHEPCIPNISSFFSITPNLPAEPPLATFSTVQGTILPLGPGTFTHNTADVPNIVACTKADLSDDDTDLAGAVAFGMGSMVKGKGGEWEERTEGIT